MSEADVVNPLPRCYQRDSHLFPLRKCVVWEGDEGCVELGALNRSPASITGYFLSLGLSVSICQMRELV